MDAHVTPESIVADGATSVQVRLVDRGVISDRTAGALDRAGAPIPPGTRFRAASVTKVLVATAVMRLVEFGRLGLDDRIERHLPGRFGEAGTATVQQVLGHTGGVPDYVGEVALWNPASYPAQPDAAFEERYLRMLRDPPDDERVAAMIRARPLDRDAIGRFQYSNAGYRMLAELLRAVTGVPYGQHLRDTVFVPLGMHDSLIPGDSDAIPEPAARAWHDLAPFGGGLVEVTRFSPSLIGAGGELISSTRDLATFLGALIAGDLVRPETLALMRDTTVASPEMAEYGLERFGLGLIRFTTDDGPATGGGGSIDGYATALYASADEHRIVAVAAAEGVMPFLDLAARVTALARALLERGAEAL